MKGMILAAIKRKANPTELMSFLKSQACHFLRRQLYNHSLGENTDKNSQTFVTIARYYRADVKVR
jgi:hypothetical protein